MRDMNAWLWVHLIAAIVVVALGLIQLMIKRGTAIHKHMGRLWAASLALVAISSFGIREIGGLWGFSWIHGLSIYTLVGLIAAVYYARRKQIHAHRKNMLYILLGVFFAGSFALLPGRRLGDLLWSI